MDKGGQLTPIEVFQVISKEYLFYYKNLKSNFLFLEKYKRNFAKMYGDFNYLTPLPVIKKLKSWKPRIGIYLFWLLNVFKI